MLQILWQNNGVLWLRGYSVLTSKSNFLQLFTLTQVSKVPRFVPVANPRTPHCHNLVPSTPSGSKTNVQVHIQDLKALHATG